MRLPLTNVPFVDPRYSIISRPLGSWNTRAWTREISESPPRLPRPGVERPITSSCSRVIVCPVAFPPVILRVSPAIWRPTLPAGAAESQESAHRGEGDAELRLEAVDDAWRRDVRRPKPLDGPRQHAPEDVLRRVDQP